MVGVVEGERPLQRKQVLGAVAAGERLLDRFSIGVAPVIAQVREHFGVMDRADDPQTRRANDVGNDVAS